MTRGSLVDTDALIRVLKGGVIHRAGLDLIEGEPNINLDHPLLHEPRQVTRNKGCLMSIAHNSCVLLPQIGSTTMETRTAMVMMAVRNLLTGLADLRLENEVNV